MGGGHSLGGLLDSSIKAKGMGLCRNPVGMYDSVYDIGKYYFDALIIGDKKEI